MSKKNDQRSPGSPAAARPKTPSGWVIFGIVMLGIWFMASSIIRMNELLDFYRYRSLYETNPGALVRVWRIASLSTCLLGIMTGLGFFFRREIFRKGAMFLVVFSTLLSFALYPQQGFVKYIKAISDQLGMSGGGPHSFIGAVHTQLVHAWNIRWFSESMLAWLCIAGMVVIEILAVTGIFVFLTRTSVKSAFRKRKPRY